MIEKTKVLKTGAVGVDACSRLAWDGALATMPACVDSAADVTEMSRADDGVPSRSGRRRCRSSRQFASIGPDAVFLTTLDFMHAPIKIDLSLGALPSTQRVRLPLSGRGDRTA